MKRLLALLLFAAPILAQNLTLGVKGALRLTSVPGGYGTAESQRYRVGPAVELGLPFGFALEAEALYSRLGYTITVHHIGVQSTERVRAIAWEFPVLAKYHAPLPLRPAIFFGISPRHASVRVDTTGQFFGSPNASTRQSRAHDHAWVVGGGCDVAIGHLRLGPELRYLHTDLPQYPTEWNLASYLPLPRNEVALFVGIGWSVRK